MRMVLKFGGSSLADAEKVLSAAKKAAALHRQGIETVVVVSAQGSTTDELLTRSRGITQIPSLREQDALLSCGEQMSAALMTMALHTLGCPAVSLTGWQAGILTDDCFSRARILRLQNNRLERELALGNVAVVTGFQGVSAQGDVTTLGRNGSDTTAVALAGLLGADRCRIYTDVDGVYDRDPKKYANALRFHRISYGRMLELIEAGAQVLHKQSVVLAQHYGLELEVLSSFTGGSGTVVGS